MMTLGEAAGRLARAGIEPPPGGAWTDGHLRVATVSSIYDEIDRALTWGHALLGI